MNDGEQGQEEPRRELHGAQHCCSLRCKARYRGGGGLEAGRNEH
jgi:hypothetical protein